MTKDDLPAVHFVFYRFTDDSYYVQSLKGWFSLGYKAYLDRSRGRQSAENDLPVSAWDTHEEAVEECQKLEREQALKN
jgi:hypothetical protein